MTEETYDVYAERVMAEARAAGRNPLAAILVDLHKRVQSLERSHIHYVDGGETTEASWDTLTGELNASPALTASAAKAVQRTKKP